MNSAQTRVSTNTCTSTGLREMVFEMKLKYLTDRHGHAIDFIRMILPRMLAPRSRLRLMVPATFLIMMYGVGALMLHYHSGTVVLQPKRGEPRKANRTISRLPKTLIEPPREKVCNRNTSTLKVDPAATDLPVTYYVSKEHKIQVCSVPKAGSTFLTATMAIVNGLTNNLTAQDVLSMSKKEIHRKFEDELRLDLNDIMRNYSGETIIPVRNPYSRLYSTYIERVYLPSDWSLSVEIKKVTRSKTDQNADPKTICADGVTFSEFLRYISRKSNAFLDPQWAPITSICNMCDQAKVRLLHEETFVEDLDKLLFKKIRLKIEVQEAISAYLRPNSKTEILSTVTNQLNIGFDSQSQYCISRNEVLRRIWKALQLQGHLSKTQPLPKENYKGSFTNAQAKIRFKHDLLKALDDVSKPLGKVLAQRGAALANAYSGVSVELIRNIQRIYADDFELLGYNTSPPKQT